MTDPEPSSSRQKTFALTAIGLSVLVTLGAAEIGLRVYHVLLDEPEPEPKTERRVSGFMYDERLGHRPRPGLHHNGRGWSFEIDAESLRRNGGPPPASAEPPLLAVGDSFTFGDEVNDDQTWPARLERRLGRRVINGGVSAFGLDQAVLRAEQLLESHSPSHLIVALISGDINRLEMSRRGKWKPYFDIEDGALVLRNVPVPQGDVDEGALKRGLQHSLLANAILRRVAPEWWNVTGKMLVHERGDEVARLLIDRLARETRERDMRLLIVTLAGKERDVSRLPPLVEHARSVGVPVLDLARELATLPDSAFRSQGHLTPRSNDRVAERIAALVR